jgi:hypothetical protein
VFGAGVDGCHAELTAVNAELLFLFSSLRSRVEVIDGG